MPVPMIPIATGTSPRRRGGPRPQPRVPNIPRSTPASAGEDEPAYTNTNISYGTPPRRRGGRVPPRRPGLVRRNTPASAGRTGCPAGTREASAEHPRVGGEDALPSRMSSPTGGIPPRRQGGPGVRRRGGPHRRNTPASAERTGTRSPPESGRPEHSRVGGEDAIRNAIRDAMVGTPPRRRGGRGGPGRGRVRGHNTPASAGRTSAWCRSKHGWTEHPRVGEKDELKCRELGPVVGTPPRRPGGQRDHVEARAETRNTPASRRRGGRPQSRRPLRRHRNTPASAGRTRHAPAYQGGYGTPPALAGRRCCRSSA